MRDGVKLYTEIFLPSRNKEITEPSGFSYPVIFSRSPYPYSCLSRNGRVATEHFLAANYVVVFQLTRGQGESEGQFRFFKDDLNDGFDAITWIADQDWCNGNIGMMGSSYLGNVQLLAARTKPPALKCIMPTAFVGSFTRYFPFAHGVPHRGYFMQWHQAVDAKRADDMDCIYGDMNALKHTKWGPAFNHRPLVDAANNVLSGDKLSSWRETISHPIDDDYWAPIHFTDEELAQLDIPIFITDGWYDMTFGPIDYFTRLEQVQPNREGRYLLVGPWNHYQTASILTKPGDNDGDRILPDNGAIDLLALRIAFFDRHLKNDQSVTVQEDRVKIYITGAAESNVNQWFNFTTFPAPETKLKELYLHSKGDARTFPGDGTLSWDKPQGEPCDHYTYDPRVPINNFVTQTYEDRRNTEIRSDVLTYTSEPLAEPLTILGEIKLILHAGSDAPDTDWFAVITEVFPDGKSKSFHYASPAFRARYREGFDREVFLMPNKPELFKMPMGSAGHQISAGNCLRLSIFSSAFSEYDPNSNTGNEAATDTEMRAAKQTIYHDLVRPSHVVLPVIELD
ncbi:CocE/NonD family hydrolase [Porticoccaceae bacterium]|nr:CocE/NonD family hydrolase [Porticoccaceae bacterium]